MPGLRTITAVDDLGDVAVVLTSVPVTRDDGSIEFDEVWQLNRRAPVEQIVAECGAAFADMTAQRADMSARCAEMRARGQRRALWLLLAALAGVLLPTPLYTLYSTYQWTLHAGQAALVVLVGVLLTAALREHRAMRGLDRA